MTFIRQAFHQFVISKSYENLENKEIKKKEVISLTLDDHY